jgi:hypothetical protein
MLQMMNKMDKSLFKRCHFFIVFIIFSLNLDNVVHTDEAEKTTPPTTTTTTTAEPLEPGLYRNFRHHHDGHSHRVCHFVEEF